MVSSRSTRRRSTPSSAGDTPSTRTAARTARRTSRERARLEVDTETGPDVEEPIGQDEGPVRTGARMTRRLAAVGVIVAVIVISLITSLRVYVDQRQQMSQAKAAIASSQEHISQLENEQQRWNDPDYVRAQARSRLGWVMPGETGYQVVDASGDPYGGGVEIDRTGGSVQQPEAWWQRLWESNQSADKPTESPTPSSIDRVAAPSASPSTGG